ncbi:transglycosylase SLT domain-containing protein [Roseovarius aestuarii]|nr:transglycosylase SLT domain-containing protein [Roseovarius aestuarii]
MLFATLSVALGNTAHASVRDVCDKAAAEASQSTGVPVSVLRALTRIETGRTRSGHLQPWPWTVNMEGVGKWFATRAEAQKYAKQYYKSGARSFDVGCFQINYRWHGNQFASIDEMFDPFLNARYAAKFLKNLYKETGDWTAAAGAYHSRTPKYASRYTTLFVRMRDDLKKGEHAPSDSVPRLATTAASRLIAYPLLRNTGAGGKNGSLVQLQNTARPALWAATKKEVDQ